MKQKIEMNENAGKNEQIKSSSKNATRFQNYTK